MDRKPSVANRDNQGENLSEHASRHNTSNKLSEAILNASYRHLVDVVVVDVRDGG